MLKFVSAISNIAIAMYIGQAVLDEFVPMLNQSIILIQNLPLQ